MSKVKRSHQRSNDKVSEIKRFKTLPQQRRVFLITYSQADLSIFPSTQKFSEEIVKAFGEKKIIEWACCMEDHVDGGKHFHMAVSFTSSLRFNPVKKLFLKNFGVSIHFKIKSYGYAAAYKYICKEKPIEEVLHSEGHSPLSRIKTPQTLKAMKTFSQKSSAVKKNERKSTRRRLNLVTSDSSSDGENEVTVMEPEEKSDGEEEEPREFLPAKLKPLEVSEFMVREGIRTRKLLMYVAKLRAKNGERDLKAFVVTHSKKFVNELIESTWELEDSEQSIEREKMARLDILAEALHGDCVETCQQHEWLRCAVSILQSNGINVYVFAAAIRNALKNGRGKGNNVLIVGPTTCGKSFLLTPLQLVYNTFSNPSNTKYAWVTLEGKEVALLNDFRWSQECIDWKDFLLLLEGDTVNLPRPKNSFTTDLTIERSNTVPFFSTSIRRFEFIGKGNSRDEGETAMMDTRWQVFTMTKKIVNPKKMEPCRRCFADLVFKGHEHDA